MQGQMLNAIREYILMRGGRMTKWKGDAASFAPSAGWAVSFLALPAAVFSTTMLVGATQVKAADECGLPVAGVVTCDATTYTTGPADDIIYSTSTGLVVNLNDTTLVIGTVTLGAEVIGTNADAALNLIAGNITVAGTALSAGLVALTDGTGLATVDMSGGTVATTGDDVFGLLALQLGLADATATISGGDVATAGSDAHGIVSVVADAASTAVATANMTGGTVTTTGDVADGLHAENDGLGDAIVVVSGGDISTAGQEAYGAMAWVVNADSTAAASATMEGTVSTAGADAAGLVARNDGLGIATATLAAGDISTAGDNGYGVLSLVDNAVSMASATAAITGGTISTAGMQADGLRAKNAGLGAATATLAAGDVSTAGDNALGVLSVVDNTASMAAATATIMGGSVTTTGAGADGLRAENGGLGDAVVDVAGGGVSTVGDLAYGALAWVVNPTSTATATATMDEGTIVTAGADARGLAAQNDGLGAAAATIAAGDISTAGDFAQGVVSVITNASSGADATTIMNGGNITTTGVGAAGLAAVVAGSGDAVVVMTGGNVEAQGNAVGIAALAELGGSYYVDVSGGTVKGGIVDSYGAAAIYVSSLPGGTIDIGAAAIVDGSASGLAIWEGNGSAAAETVVTSAGTVIGDAWLGFADDTFNLTGGSYTGTIFGDYPSLNSADDGNDTFNWSAGTLAGGVNLGNGSDAVEISASEYDGSQVLDGGDDTSRTDGFVDELTLSGLTVTANGSDIINWEVATVSGGELTIADGAWSVGTAGEAGTGVFLTDGGDLEALDALALDGNLSIASGSTFIGTGGGAGIYSVTGNVTNAGIITTQDGVVGDTFTVGGNYAGANGQLLVDVDFGTASSDLLVIEGDVVGSPTAVSVRDVTSGTANGEDVLVVDVTGTTKAGDFALAGGPITSGAFLYNLDLIDGGWYLTTDFSPAAPIYEAYPQALLALNGLPTLQQRVGNRYWRGEDLPGPAETVFCKDASQNFRCAVDGEKADYYAEKGGRGPATVEGQAIWGRIEAAHSHVEPYRSTTDAQYDTDVWKLQAGLDGVLSETESGKLVGGVTAHYGRVFTDVSSVYGDGSLSTEGYGLGANLTWYGENGFYVDGQGQFSWYDSNLNSDSLGRLVKGNDATGYALSIEAGKRIGLSGDWTVTPQAQLVYSSVDFDSFTGPNGELVSLEDGDSLRGRLGLSVERDHVWKGEEGDLRRMHLYGIANVYREFGGGTKVMVSGTSLVSQAERWTGEIGIGGSYNWADDKYAVYGELNASTGFENFADSYRLGGSVGLRVKW
ncbi:autotransporter outer membrane beta-barrel domain-containing protein [Ciceribacter sp. RN22]|uniref:autotransporter outer membrane beta-barrel domain-containing protein n=1 Tax=Ciceribacter sp. RN22 TaxID=2954932 RepID=UPI0020925458|nr:autotransporter outer membrane beta-barrel domain-containing protein [Ciceribacter sp. RN22]MCO6177495.1 autotransporter outer membrane beta-barrel domain-containing protein [Ciceribacter sp. RN22]